MISAGEFYIKKLKKEMPTAVCETYTNETEPAKKAEAAQCKAAIPVAIDKALKLYPLTNESQRKLFVNMVRRFTVAGVVFEVQDQFMKDGSFSGEEMMRAQAIHRKYVLRPAGLKKLKVVDPKGHKLYKVTYKKMIEVAAMIASRIKEDSAITPPPALMKEINLINKIFPKQWADHLVERVARLYLTSIKELKLSGVDPKKINYEKVAKQIVQKVRRFAKKAVDGRAVLPTLKIDDATAKANYKKIKEDETQKFLKPFLWDMTDTFVLKAVLKKVGTPPKDVADISFRNATAIKGAIGKSKKHPLSTHELRRISAGTAIKRHFRLLEKIKQADFIREQTVKALKRLYPQAAKLVAASGSKYLTNRNALDAKIVDMVIATVKGMKKAFKKHYASKTAPDMALRELEARKVVLKAGTKNPDYVVFKLSLHKATGGASQTTYIDPIVNGGSGNRTLRRAVAVRRYQDAKIILDKKFKDPKVRAKKTEKMKASLVKALKNLSLNDLLLSAVDGVKDDGSVKIKFADKIFLKYAETGWLGAQLRKLAGLANVKRPKANDGADLYVDGVDRSKFIFKDAVNSNKDKLKGKDGSLDPKKLQALAAALVDLIRKMQLDPKGDRSGTRWTKTGKGATFTIKPTMVKKYYKKVIKDEDGNKIGERWKSRMVPGFKVTDLKLSDRFGGGVTDCGGGICISGKNYQWRISGGGLLGLQGPSVDKKFGVSGYAYADLFHKRNVLGKNHRLTLGLGIDMAGVTIQGRQYSPHPRSDGIFNPQTSSLAERVEMFRITKAYLGMEHKIAEKVKLAWQLGAQTARAGNVGGTLDPSKNFAFGLGDLPGGSKLLGFGASVSGEIHSGKKKIGTWKIKIAAGGKYTLTFSEDAIDRMKSATHSVTVGGEIKVNLGEHASLAAMFGYMNVGATSFVIPKPDGGTAIIKNKGSQAVTGEVNLGVKLMNDAKKGKITANAGLRFYYNNPKGDFQPEKSTVFTVAASVEYMHPKIFKLYAGASYRHGKDELSWGFIPGVDGPQMAAAEYKHFSLDLGLLFRIPIGKAAVSVGPAVNVQMNTETKKALYLVGGQLMFGF